MAQPSPLHLPPIGSFGDMCKGNSSDPDIGDWDMGLMKNLTISVQYRAEMFNSLNHSNFMDDDTVQTKHCGLNAHHNKCCLSTFASE